MPGRDPRPRPIVMTNQLSAPAVATWDRLISDRIGSDRGMESVISEGWGAFRGFSDFPTSGLWVCGSAGPRRPAEARVLKYLIHIAFWGELFGLGTSYLGHSLALPLAPGSPGPLSEGAITRLLFPSRLLKHANHISIRGRRLVVRNARQHRKNVIQRGAAAEPPTRGFLRQVLPPPQSEPRRDGRRSRSDARLKKNERFVCFRLKSK